MSGITTLSTFLLDRIRAEGAESADSPTPARMASRRAEIVAHGDRSMTVISRHGAETVTRCRTCPKETSSPCRALRLLALPYAAHPDYRSEWGIDVDREVASTTPNGVPE